MKKLDLFSVDWRHDGITREFVRENKEELEHPEKMKPSKLGVAVTYCLDIYNPFAEELMRRSGHLEKFRTAFSEKEKNDVFKKSCLYHGMIIM